jgi:hypothetical protein
MVALIGFILGAACWWLLAPRIRLDERLRYDARPVWRLLLTQLAAVFVIWLVLLLFGASLGQIFGAPFRWLALLVNLVFWGYLGALALTFARSVRVRR